MAATLSRTGTNTRHSGKGAKMRAAEGEAMLADYVKGMRPTALAEKYGVSRATAERRLADTIAQRRRVTTEAYREQQNALLDELMAGHQQNYEAGTALVQRGSGQPVGPEHVEREPDVDLIERGLSVRAKALDGMAKVAERRAKLNGTDAPVKTEVEVTQVTAQERELSDLLDQAAREQQAREAMLNDEAEASA